jgi:hypothetical protein
MTFYTGGAERMRIETNGNISLGATVVDSGGAIELSTGLSGDRNSYIDFCSHGAAGSIDYSARLLRNPGANGDFSIVNTGTGNIALVGNVTATGTVTAPNLFGQGQTWQDVTGSRSKSTTYTNTTARPIQVLIYALNTTTVLTINIGGVTADLGSTGTTGGGGQSSFIIPPGVSYSVTGTPAVTKWLELR